MTVGARLGEHGERGALTLPPPVAAGRAAALAARAFAANITSVRTLIDRTSSTSTPAPSAIPRISST